LAHEASRHYREGMAGGDDGTGFDPTGASGGWRGMNGAQRRTAILALGGFLTIVVMVMIANALSTITDLRSTGARVPDHLIWSWEWTSMIGWLSLYPALWWTTGRIRPPRFGWAAIVVLFLAGSGAASAWHIGVMVALRHAYYVAVGEGPYRFFGMVGDRIAYEYRKDLVTFSQFVVIACVVRWMIARNADLPAASAPVAPSDTRRLVVADGGVRRSIPHDQIESVAAAGNYVEVNWAGRTLLHRTTLTAVEAELGDTFARVHRGTLVRLGAISHVEVDRSGDFSVTLDSGTVVRGSRRYRGSIDR